MTSDVYSYVKKVEEDDFVPLTSTDPGGDNAKIDPRDEGSIAKLITRRLMGSEDLSVSIARIAPGQYHLKHHHPDGSEFYYFVKGECLVHVDGEDIVAVPGTSIYLPPNTVHSLRNEGTEVVELVCGLSKPEYAEIGLVYDE